MAIMSWFSGFRRTGCAAPQRLHTKLSPNFHSLSLSLSLSLSFFLSSFQLTYPDQGTKLLPTDVTERAEVLQRVFEVGSWSIQKIFCGKPVSKPGGYPLKDSLQPTEHVKRPDLQAFESPSYIFLGALCFCSSFCRRDFTSCCQQLSLV